MAQVVNGDGKALDNGLYKVIENVHRIAASADLLEWTHLTLLGDADHWNMAGLMKRQGRGHGGKKEEDNPSECESGAHVARHRLRLFQTS
jgi:hypothetical protein